VLVGMDTPQLDAGVVAAAFEPWPTDVDAWFGPAADGGFWLLGLRGMPDRGDLIRGVPMSRDDTGRIQRERLAAAGLGIRDLPTLRDVDDAAALDAVVATIPGSRTAATVRAAAIRRDLDPRTTVHDG
ncbi:DUF2064 domain-containing protein, partial [Burkholderia cenocepacia]|uniref:DUF2064 domain-containing protein n=1 Tax=Burkholderia cenocepacia TaxID=95486 RepID=UPI0038CC0F04